MRRGEVWLGVFFVALALPLMAHDVSWLVHHLGSFWALHAVLPTLLHGWGAVVPSSVSSLGPGARLLARLGVNLL